MKIQIRHNPSGEIREYEHDLFLQGVESSVYLYSEGNYSCDCNRRLFFIRAKDPEASEDNPCGTGMFSVRIIHPETKEVLYSEF